MRHYFHGGIHPADGTDKLFVIRYRYVCIHPNQWRFYEACHLTVSARQLLRVKDKVSREI